MRARGYTLLELVIAIVVMGVLGGYLVYAVWGSAQAYVDLRGRAANAADAHHALELMSREIQEIRSAVPADVPAMSTTDLSFTDVSGAAVEYAFSGTTLTRNGQTLLDRLESFSFAYAKADGTAASEASDLWTVEVSMTLLRSDRRLTLRTRMFPRNFTSKYASWRKA